MHAYHASVELSEDEDEDTQNAPIVSASTIKTWIRILVKRSLLLEVIKGSVSLHGLFKVSLVFIWITHTILDIVRDYIMKQTDKKQLKVLQRAFVHKIISSQDTWEPSIGETIVKGKELDWYAPRKHFDVYS